MTSPYLTFPPQAIKPVAEKSIISIFLQTNVSVVEAFEAAYIVSDFKLDKPAYPVDVFPRQNTILGSREEIKDINFFLTALLFKIGLIIINDLSYVTTGL